MGGRSSHTHLSSSTRERKAAALRSGGWETRCRRTDGAAAPSASLLEIEKGTPVQLTAGRIEAKKVARRAVMVCDVLDGLLKRYDGLFKRNSSRPQGRGGESKGFPDRPQNDCGTMTGRREETYERLVSFPSDQTRNCRPKNKSRLLNRLPTSPWESSHVFGSGTG